MRDIIFRGKRIDNGEWVCSGNLIHFNEDNQYFIANLNDKCISTHDENDHIVAIEDTRIYKVIPETVGQYTGLTDKNGKRVFEGDIVALRAGRPHEVKYNNGGFELVGTAISIIHVDKFNVIGNIHDNKMEDFNPEFLKGGD